MFNIFYGGSTQRGAGGSGLSRGSDRPRRGRRNCLCYPKLANGQPNYDIPPLQVNDCLQFVKCPTCCANRVGENYTGVDAVTRRYQNR